MAQGYQDITGQVLQRVIKLVQEVEQNLVDMLCLTGQSTTDEVQLKVVKDNKGYGPAVPGTAQVKQNEILESQDDVDNLLSTLGF